MLVKTDPMQRGKGKGEGGKRGKGRKGPKGERAQRGKGKDLN